MAAWLHPLSNEEIDDGEVAWSSPIKGEAQIAPYSKWIVRLLCVSDHWPSTAVPSREPALVNWMCRHLSVIGHYGRKKVPKPARGNYCAGRSHRFVYRRLHTTASIIACGMSATNGEIIAFGRMKS